MDYDPLGKNCDIYEVGDTSIVPNNDKVYLSPTGFNEASAKQEALVHFRKRDIEAGTHISVTCDLFAPNIK